MGIILDFKTGRQIRVTQQVNPDLPNWMSPIGALAARFDTTIENVFKTPKIKTNKAGQLVIKTYIGNVHTSKMIDHGGPVRASMPLPCNPDAYINYIKANNIKHVLLEDECFQYMDRKYRMTLRLLERLSECPSITTVEIYTRSDLFGHDSYLELLEALKNKGIELTFKCYGMTLSERTNKIKWPGSPSVKRRQRALNKVNDRLKLYIKAI